MQDTVVIPRTVWEALVNKLDFVVKTIQPLAKGYKASKWMTAEEAMEFLGIKKDRLKQIRQSGKIDYEKAANGRTIMYSREDIEDYRSGHIVLPTKEKQPAVTGIQ